MTITRKKCRPEDLLKNKKAGYFLMVFIIESNNKQNI